MILLPVETWQDAKSADSLGRKSFFTDSSLSRKDEIADGLHGRQM